MDQKTINQVTATVRRFLPPGCDAEGLAIEIIMEALANGQSIPSRVLIRSRCWDEMRRFQREKYHLERYRFPEVQPDQSENINRLNHLTKVLDTFERKLVAYRFYVGMSISEIAKKLHYDINKVRETLAAAIFKMRNVEDEGDES